MIVLTSLGGGLTAEARAVTAVGDVSVVDQTGTVTVTSDRRGAPAHWITRDGGRTFRRLKVRGQSFTTATVLANGLGYAYTRHGRLWRTTNGGRTWRRTPVRDVIRLTATSTSVWTVRARGRRVRLTRSEDGGRRWHTRSLRVGGSEGPAVHVSFADAADGVITGLRPGRSGKPFMLVTRNGGHSWTERRAPCSADAVNVKGPPPAQWLASGTLWLVCVGPGGAGAEALAVHTSTDAGRTFALQSRAPLPGTGGPAVGRLAGAGHFNAFSAVTNDRAFMSFGHAFTATRDGGRHWRVLRHLPRRLDGGISALSVDGRARYLALGTDGLWKSPDAGAHWQRLRLRGKN